MQLRLMASGATWGLSAAKSAHLLANSVLVTVLAVIGRLTLSTALASWLLCYLASRIVVLNGGGIEQVGTPKEIYELPRTEFVARFIGGTNVLHGKPISSERISVNGVEIACSDRARLDPARGDGAVSIRMHQIGLSRSQPDGSNVAAGKVVRRVYVGAAHDYLVALHAGPQVRVTTPATFEANIDDTVWATFPREHCLALS